MPLTGRLLIALTIGGTAIVLAATVWSWSRTGWLRFILRPTGVLLTEALLLVSIGLIVNRHENFYPSWEALLDTTNQGQPSYKTEAGSLDGAVAARAKGNASVSELLPWQPTGWTDWHLASAPKLVIPAGYSEHPQWRYSVVLVISNSTSGWPPGWQQAAGLSDAAGANRDLVIFVTTTPATALVDLVAELPTYLRHDLRVSDHRWAIVTSSAEAGPTHAAALTTPGIFPAIATVQDAAASVGPSTKSPPNTSTKPPGSKPGSPKPAGEQGDAVAQVEVASATAKQIGATAVPDGITTFTVRADVKQGGFTIALTTAITWAASQTPPPLAASAQPVKSLPISKRPKTKVSPDSLGAPVPLPADGRIDGPGQPRH